MKGIVWGADRETCGRKLKQLIEDYALYWNVNPIKTIMTQNIYRVEFENGDKWQAMVARESARGHRCNISLVDRNIDYDFTSNIIEHCTTAGPFNAIRYY